MKTWKLVSMFLLAFVAGACDDESAGEIDGGVGSAEQADVVWGYEAKTVLKNSGEVRVPLKLSRAVNSAVKITVEAEKRDVNTIAREGIDFNIPEKVVTIPAGDTIAFLKLDLLDDGKMTIDREIKLRMTGVYGGGKMGELKTTSLYIVNNAFVEFEKAKWETWESANVETSSEVVRNSRFVPLVITGELTEAATIVLEVTDRSAIEPTHFTVEKEFRVSPGQTRIEVEVKPVDDSEINDDRIFILKIKEIRGGNLVLGKATPECEVKILSEEIQRNLFWEKTELNVEDKEAVLDIPVVLDKVPLAAFTVDIEVDADGTDAVEGVDYEILTPQVSIDASRKATVQVKVLNNREINAGRTLALKFANITDNTIFVNNESNTFTLAIDNSDFPTFEEKGEELEIGVYEYKEVWIAIPAVDRERTITLKYSTTETEPGTYFDDFTESVIVSANANRVSVPLITKYTINFPKVAPRVTMSIEKVDDFVLDNGETNTYVLTQNKYSKWLGEYTFTDTYAKWTLNVIVTAGSTGEEIAANWNKKLVVKSLDGVLGLSDAQWYIEFDPENTTGNLLLNEKLFNYDILESDSEGNDIHGYIYWIDWSTDGATQTIPVIFKEDGSIIWDTNDYFSIRFKRNESTEYKDYTYFQNITMTKK